MKIDNFKCSFDSTIDGKRVGDMTIAEIREIAGRWIRAGKVKTFTVVGYDCNEVLELDESDI